MANSGSVLGSFNPQPGERRRSQRYPFTATADVMDSRSHLQISARTSDLDYRGCYVDTLNPFVAGTSIVLRIAKDSQSFTTMATVIYAHTGMGMGVIFDTLAHEQLRVLERWLTNSASATHAEIHAAQTPHTPPLQSAVNTYPAPSPMPKPAAVAPPQAVPAASVAPKENTEVLKYLVLMLVQKGVLVEFEGQALLERLLDT
jgi:hypothetical protein